MKVTRDVVLDLLPLYLAGEASKETQELVKGYLESDPDLAKLARQWQERLPAPPPAAMRPDAQTLAYREAKRLLTIRTIVVAAVITVGVIALIALIGAMLFLRVS